jgi:Ca2+-binding EF-hand superfamily protein
MKKIVILCLSLISISFTSFGQSKGENNKHMKLDVNKDGVLSREEFNAKASQQVKQIDLRMDKTFDRIDANKDGVLDKAEMRNARTKRKGMNRGQGARKGPKAKRNKGNRPIDGRKNSTRKVKKRANEKFNTLDRNGNGTLNFREFKKGAKQRPNYSRANAKRMFNRIDKNNDGIVNADEFTRTAVKRKGLKQRRQRMRRGGMGRGGMRR